MNKNKNNKFFMISNLGGGGGNKYRETVYRNIYGEIPLLCNYYYMKYGTFARKELKTASKSDNFNDFMKVVQNKFIKKNFSYKNYASVRNINQTFLLDSGASNILRDLIRNNKISKNVQQIKSILWNEALNYYKFANNFKFNIVIGFDTGGKYTFKGKEKYDYNYIEKMKFINNHSSEINDYLRFKSFEYVQNNPNFYPKLYLTVHGSSPKRLTLDLDKLITLSTNIDMSTFGIAIGGIASYRNVDNSWFPNNIKGKDKNPYLAYKSTKMVSDTFPNTNIHILGGGNIKNIFPLLLAGASSFDCQTPGRRAYDANNNSAKEIYNKNSNANFSKYLIGKLNCNGKLINKHLSYKYVNLNKVTDDLELCGCPACNLYTSISQLKKLYSLGTDDKEGFFFAKQLINIHSIYQHIYLCKYSNNYLNMINFNALFNNETSKLYESILKGDI